MLDADSLRDAHTRLVPGMEPGTLKSRRAGDSQASFTSYALELIRLKRLTKAEVAVLVRGDEVHLAHRYRVCQVWQEHLDGASAPAPKAKDVFVDSAGAEWVVDRVLEHKLLGNVHNCLVFKSAG